jgi:hypothetical protein
MAASMSLIGSRHYLHIRHLVGASIPARQARRLEPLGNPDVVERELAVRLRSRVPEVLAAVGCGGLLIVILFMMIKPF